MLPGVSHTLTRAGGDNNRASRVGYVDDLCRSPSTVSDTNTTVRHLGAVTISGRSVCHLDLQALGGDHSSNTLRIDHRSHAGLFGHVWERCVWVYEGEGWVRVP